jgi:hypothetical protein
VRPIELERGTPIVFWVQILESVIQYWTCDILYRLALQNRPKFNKIWESYNKFHLTCPILVRPMALQRGKFKLLHVKISESRGAKFQKYIKRKVSQEDRLQIMVSNVCLLKTIINFDWDAKLS